MIRSSFNLLSEGDGGQWILGVQLGSAGTMDLKKEKILDSRWWIMYSF